MNYSKTAFFSLLAVMILLFSCGKTEEKTNLTPGWTDEDSRKAEKVLGSLEYGKASALDFSDKDHYDFYVRQFINAGITPETSPNLFKVFEQMRVKATTNEMSFLPMPAPQTSGDNTLDPINQISTINSDDGKSWIAAGISSVPGGTQVTHLALSLYDDQHNLIGSNSASSFTHGDTLSVSANGSVNTSQAVKASLTYFYQTKAGLPGQGTHTLVAENYPQSVDNIFPADTNSLSPNQILICLYRTESGKCDYWRDESSPFPVQFPIKGSITYFDAIDQPFNSNNSFVYINLIDENSGGGCEYAKIDNFFDNVTISNDNKTLSWDLSLANFGNACSGNLNPVIYSMYLEVTVQGETVGYTISTADNLKPGRNTKVLPEMEIAYGCLAGGTEITMADGSLEAIEDVMVGETVLTKEGQALEVTSSTIGRENTIWEMITSNGKTVLLTDEHPLPTTEGIKLAKELKIGDQVYSQEGLTSIERIGQIDFPKEYVFNLYVNYPDGGINLDDRLFYANGILVGDNEMQKVYAFQYITDDQNILNALDPEWHEDYKIFRSMGTGK